MTTWQMSLILLSHGFKATACLSVVIDVVYHLLKPVLNIRACVAFTVNRSLPLSF